MRILPSLLVSLLATTSISAQNWDQTHARKDLELFLQRNFAGQDSVSLSSAYRKARSLGWLPTGIERKLIKRQLSLLAGERRSQGRAIDLRSRTVNPDPRRRAAPAAVVEAEYNGSEGYANYLGILLTPLSATGTFTLASDKDSYRFETILDGEVTFKTTSTGSQPDLMITSASGDENWGYHYYDGGTVVVQLPRGSYHVSLAGTVSTNYSLALTFKAKTIETLRLGAKTAHTFGTDPKLLRVVLPKDGRLGLKLTNIAQVDGLLGLLNDKWGFVYDVDEASTATNGEPGLDALLPAGTYYLYLWADASGTESLTSTFQSQAIPTLSASATGVLAGIQESFDLFKVVLTQPAFVDFRVLGNGTSPTTDPYLMLYDRNMVQILEGDDDPNGSMASIGVTLPAGTYYIASTAYFDGGGYRITRATSVVATRNARAGSNPGTVAQFSSVAFRFQLATPSWIEMDLDDGAIDGQVGVLDWKTGLAISWEDDENLGPQDCNFGLHLPAGDYLFVVKDYSSDGGAFELRLLPPLQRWLNDNVMVRGHAGDPLFFVVGSKSASYNPFPGLITGNLLIDLQTAVILPLVMPAGGIIDFKTSLAPGTGVLLQMVAIDSKTGLGTYSNLLK